jgi:hypothetical protein
LKSSRKPTPRSATRVECYVPQHFDQDAYDIAYDWLCDEFTYAHGGCSAIKGIDGQYRSVAGFVAADRITLVWCDLPWRRTMPRERADAAAYASGLRDYLSELLPQEEVIYVALLPVSLLD